MTDDAAKTGEENILGMIRRRAQEVVPTTGDGSADGNGNGDGDGAQLAADRSLEEAGCNSIDRAEILALVMEDLGVVVPLDEFERSLTLRQIAELLRKHQ